jgi:hypothetical protein
MPLLLDRMLRLLLCIPSRGNVCGSFLTILGLKVPAVDIQPTSRGHCYLPATWEPFPGLVDKIRAHAVSE